MPRVPDLTTLDLLSPRWPAYATLAPGWAAPDTITERALDRGHRLFVAYGADGAAQGVLLIKANRHGMADSLHVVVRPERRRRGVASALYARAARVGFAVEQLSGRGGLTPDGVAFRQGRRAT